MAPRFEKVGVLVEPTMHHNASTQYRIRVLGRYGLQVFAEASRTWKEVESVHEYLSGKFEEVPCPPKRCNNTFKWIRVSRTAHNIRRYLSALLRSREIVSDDEVLRFFGTKSLALQNNATNLSPKAARAASDAASSASGAATRRRSMPGGPGYARAFSDPQMSRRRSVEPPAGGEEGDDLEGLPANQSMDYVNAESLKDDMSWAAFKSKALDSEPGARTDALHKAFSESTLTLQLRPMLEIHDSLSLWPTTGDE